MGATASVPFSDAASNAALQRLGGPNEIPPHDPAWVRVLSEAPLAKADASLLHQKLEATLTGLRRCRRGLRGCVPARQLHALVTLNTNSAALLLG